MIDRQKFLPPAVPDCPERCVPLGPELTVPTERMAYLLADLLRTRGEVLEIGTGSGYQTAVLAERCQYVFSIEINPDTLMAAAARLPENVALIQADGCYYDTGSQFDAILVCFAVRHLMAAWVKQLRAGGRLVVPLVAGARHLARISVYQKDLITGVMELVEAPAYANFTEQVQEVV